MQIISQFEMFVACTLIFNISTASISPLQCQYSIISFWQSRVPSPRLLYWIDNCHEYIYTFLLTCYYSGCLRSQAVQSALFKKQIYSEARKESYLCSIAPRILFSERNGQLINTGSAKPNLNMSNTLNEFSHV